MGRTTGKATVSRQGSAKPNRSPAKFRSASSNDGRCPECGQLTGENDTGLMPEAIVKRAERILHVSETIALKAQHENDSRLALLAVDRCQRSIDTLARFSIKNSSAIMK